MKSVGILGLPQSGKSTLFEILLQGAGIPAAGHGRDLAGVVRVPDRRVNDLAAIYKPKKTAYAQIQFVDSAAAGSSRGAARGSDLFASVRQSDALLAMVRDFESPALPAENGVDPVRDLRNLEAELILNDLAIVETRMERIEKELRIGKKEGEAEHEFLGRCRAILEAERPLRAEAFDADAEKRMRSFTFLSRKPLLVVYNQGESSSRAPADPGPNTLAVALRAHLEREIVTLPQEERAAFRSELGVEDDGLSLVIRACYRLLGLISFFTVGPDEVRAWTLREGERAVDAAGEIHSDLAKGFIRAEVIEVERLLEAGGHPGARERGWLRLEGRDYRVKDGDCLEIRFNK